VLVAEPDLGAFRLAASGWPDAESRPEQRLLHPRIWRSVRRLQPSLVRRRSSFRSMHARSVRLDSDELVGCRWVSRRQLLGSDTPAGHPDDANHERHGHAEHDSDRERRFTSNQVMSKVAKCARVARYAPWRVNTPELSGAAAGSRKHERDSC
jgi:hypothetical protein